MKERVKQIKIKIRGVWCPVDFRGNELVLLERLIALTKNTNNGTISAIFELMLSEQCVTSNDILTGEGSRAGKIKKVLYTYFN